MKSALLRKADVLNAAQALQSITGQRPTFVRSKSNVQAFKLRPGIPSIFVRRSAGLTIRLAGRGEGSNSRSSNVGLSLYSSRDRSPSGPRLWRPSFRSEWEEWNYQLWIPRQYPCIVPSNRKSFLYSLILYLTCSKLRFLFPVTGIWYKHCNHGNNDSRCTTIAFCLRDSV